MVWPALTSVWLTNAGSIPAGEGAGGGSLIDAAARTGNLEVSLADGADPDVAEFASGRFVMRACLFFVDLGEDDVATRAAEAAAAVLMVV